MSGIVGGINLRSSGLVNLGSASDSQILTGTGVGLPVGFEAAAGGSEIVQYKSLVDTTLSSSTALVDPDDSPPTSSEGVEIFGSGLAITPTVSTNTLVIDAVASCGASTTNCMLTLALFQDSATDCTTVSGAIQTWHGYPNLMHLRWVMEAGTTSETTFHIRLGGHSGTAYCNWNYTGPRDYGARMFSTFTIMEIDES